MNFQLNQNQRLNHANFFSRQRYESGKNILLNRLTHLNGKIEKSWLESALTHSKLDVNNCSYKLPHKQQRLLGTKQAHLRSLPSHVTLKYNLNTSQRVWGIYHILYIESVFRVRFERGSVF